MSEALGASTSQDNGDSGSDALITYMQSHCSPEVELFSASVLTRSADKARDHNCYNINNISVTGG